MELEKLIKKRNQIQIEIKNARIIEKQESINKNGSTLIRVPNRFNDWINSLLKERVVIGKSPMDKTKAIELITKHKHSLQISEDIINFELNGDIKI